MTDTDLSGPDFLDNVADLESGNGLHINAAEYRKRAREWRQEQQQLRDAQDQHQRLAEEVSRVRTHLTQASKALANVSAAA